MVGAWRDMEIEKLPSLGPSESVEAWFERTTHNKSVPDIAWWQAVPAGGAGAVRALVAVGKRKEAAGGLRLLGAVAAAYALSLIHI